MFETILETISNPKFMLVVASVAFIGAGLAGFERDQVREWGSFVGVSRFSAFFI